MDEDSIEARAILQRTAPGDLDRGLYTAWAAMQQPTGPAA
jgi:hypothetical protein